MLSLDRGGRAYKKGPVAEPRVEHLPTARWVSYGVAMSEHRDDLKRHELILAMSRALDEVRATIESGEPDWDPLHGVLPFEHCHGFMWMARANWDGAIIEQYKHGITRRYLMLSHDGRAFLYRAKRYVEIPTQRAIDRVFEGIEEMGATRATRYDDAYRREKYRRLRELGWTVVT